MAGKSIDIQQGDVRDEFCCAATGRPLYFPVVTLQGVAYCYSALVEMFMQAQGVPVCVVTKEPIYFLPNVCAPLHHYMIDEYKKDLKGRKQVEEMILDKLGLKLPLVADTPDDEDEEGWLEDFECAVSGELAYEPCCLSSGTIVSAYCVPTGGFQKDPNRLVACGSHSQAPRKSKVLEEMIKTKFPSQYKSRAAAVSGTVSVEPQPLCRSFKADEHMHFGLGCDGCGLWPIRGTAWEDADCRSSIGFHLCQQCYDLSYHKRVMGGRFNQGHMPKNTMVKMTEGDF
eukprot:TRINITY_DN81615_c0_g1_i1.p1 TRINITY_DN81615_c0_g1~~TRINITY_DN81615_c0_g1_i1.p1  ORF type:complete len:299 (+),score=44.49 TRINITY_DN81615_c0_g1_i1:45-899(+)